MTVEPGLPDQYPRPSAVPCSPGVDPRADLPGAGRVEAEALSVDAGGRAVLAEDAPQGVGPLAGRGTGPRAGDRSRHQIRAAGGRVAQRAERPVDLRLAPLAPGGAQQLERRGRRGGVELEETAVVAADQRRRQALGPAVPTDDHHLARVDPRQPLGLAADERRLHVAGLDRRERAAHLLDARDLRRRRFAERRHLRGVLEEIGLVRQDLLQPERPLLIPRPRQAERLVPRGQLERAATGIAAERHAERLEEDPPGVVLRLLLGEPERVHLHAVPEEAVLRVRHAVAIAGDRVPHRDERPHLAHLLDEADAGVHEERDAADGLLELLGGEAAALADGVEHRHGVGEREGELLRRRRSRLLQMVGADVRGVPPRNAMQAVVVHVDDQLHRGPRRKDVGPARQVLLDDVVLRGALEDLRVDAALLGEGDVEREQPHRRRVDGHRRVQLLDRDAVEEHVEVVDRVDRDADLAHLGASDGMVGAVAALRGKVERDREPRLPAREVPAVERVRFADVGVSRVGPEDPGLVATGHESTPTPLCKPRGVGATRRP